jgi:hypothetical protein
MVTMKKMTLGLSLCFGFPLLAHAEGLLAVDNPAKNSQERGAYAAFEAFEGNDQIAMRQYGKDWLGDYSPRDDTNLGLLSARAETGVQWQGYRLGALYRAEGLVEANRDTSDLVRQYKTSSGYDVGRTYQVDYRIKVFEADGARLSKSFQLALGSQWQMDWGLGLSYLRGKRIKLETVSGQVVTLNTKDFNAAASLDDTNSRMNISDLAKFNALYGLLATPSGQGYALDAGMVLRHGESGFSAELAVADLAGRMEWKDLPNNIANYNTATKYYDANGYVQFNPTATRISSYRDLAQNLDPKVWLAANYPIGNFELQGASSYTRGYWFPQAGVTYHITPQWGVKADYDFRFNSLGFSLLHKWFYLGLRTDSTSVDKAKAYGLNGGVNISF